MKFLHFIVITIFVVVTSCTIDKTNYEDEIRVETTEFIVFEEVISLNDGNYSISIEALNGTFYQGYNEIHLKIINTQNNENLNNSDVTFLPIMTDANGNKLSCPHKYNLEYDATNNYYMGYVVFPNESNTTISWELYIGYNNNSQLFTTNKSISVQEQTNMNLNMTAFTGNDGEQYFIALVYPQSPAIAENDLIAGIYRYNKPSNPAGIFPDPSQYSYSIVENHTLLLDPRMPEPSMGNHSSPNNLDLTQQSDGLYHGVVNYTMTGNWTLNFIFQNQNGQTIKGTEVSTDFTPGIEGAKSELYIDILF
ncbi:hypothetical protein APS56_10390 [Pseudalgibacter alginicilyticus]|uniref:YtkA-like domain-containing protein n=1 Tax=Pseudalgibacter alginicilyticus TaxID=1736674 RepID=A0A0N7HYK4_9FLAO|nr:hypothetical protein [Pseudalgibacter alginicilyticus]ALJ05502.1 hypothetical protein APS56_10390 [Pseudalgibacter alginicilyticus]